MPQRTTAAFPFPPQALRLFVHYPFLVRASAHCHHTGVQAEGDAEGDCLAGEAIRWAGPNKACALTGGRWFGCHACWTRDALCWAVHFSSW